MRILNTLCALAVEVVLLLVIALTILAPVSAHIVRHLDVVQTIDSSHALIAGDVSGLSPGSTISLYRFNPDWKAPIGRGRVERADAGIAEIAIDPKEMRWPLGRQGVIHKVADGSWEVSVGPALGFQKGDVLNVFAGRAKVGQALITRLGASQSQAEVYGEIPEDQYLIASEFTYATAAAYTPLSAMYLEGLLIALVVLVYAAAGLYLRHSPFLTIGAWFRARSSPITGIFWIANMVATLPFAYFLAKMPPYLLAYVIEFVAARVGHPVSISALAGVVFPYLFCLVLVASYGYLLVRRRSPILAFWRLISYTRKSTVKRVSLWRGLMNWALHLIIVYAFGLTLLGFLMGDIAAARAIGPHPSSLSELADFWKYVIWSLTVVGVLFGYGYSVVNILWGRFIRNLDFTLQGWLTNGFCYPLFGVVVWQLVPGFTGPDPIYAGGPVEWLALSLGFLLNLFYMLSIWNLGTMFDLMADKGVRSNLFYSVIRHPNYTLEAMMFFVTELVGLSTGAAWLGISLYFFLYWIRSEREDNFMWYSNPGYEAYQNQTPYKFIPGIY